MRSGTCPRCGESDVRRVDAMKGAHDHLNLGGLIPGTLTNYLCVRCGYLESYIEDEGKLSDVASRFPRFEAQEKR